MIDPGTVVLTVMVSMLVPMYLTNSREINKLKINIAKLEEKIDMLLNYVVNGKRK